MKRIYLIALMLLAVNSNSEPGFQINETQFSFGKVPQNSIVYHYFWFKSTGDDTLVIKDIKTGCVCSVMPFEQDKIAPGDSVKIGIEWEFKNRLNNSFNAPFIFTNVREEPFRFTMQAWVVQANDSLMPLAVSPYKYEFARFSQKDITEIKFKLINRSDEDAMIKVISYPIEQCEVTFPEKLDANSEYNGIIKVKDEYLDKEFTNSITLEVTNKKDFRVTIPIRRKIY